MKEQKKAKKVSWASGANLCQVYVYLHINVIDFHFKCICMTFDWSDYPKKNFGLI